MPTVGQQTPVGQLGERVINRQLLHLMALGQIFKDGVNLRQLAVLEQGRGADQKPGVILVWLLHARQYCASSYKINSE